MGGRLHTHPVPKAFTGVGIMSKEAEKTPIYDDRYSRAPPVTLGVVAIWLLAIALGVALSWTLLLHAAPAIVGLIMPPFLLQAISSVTPAPASCRQKRPGSRTKRLLRETTTNLTVPSKLESRQRKPQSLVWARAWARAKIFLRQCGNRRRNAVSLTPFQGCGHAGARVSVLRRDTPQANPPGMGGVFS